MSALPWPPSYSIRRSCRAKSIGLAISPVRGLEIVLPRWSSEQQGIEYLLANRRWIEKHAEALCPIRIAAESTRYELPQSLNLALIAETFPIQYRIKQQVAVSFAVRDGVIFFTGNFKDFKPCIPKVKAWLHAKAKQVLPKKLSELSQQYGFSYNRVTIRCQQTLWGSCSSKHSISLNQKLLFLPPRLVRYVLIHELCHTRHFNHSKRFWALVAKYEPECRLLDKRLNQTEQFIPKWYLYA